MNKLAAIFAVASAFILGGKAVAQTNTPWQGEVELYAGVDSLTSVGYYTNHTANVQILTTASFVNTISSSADDGNPFTQIQATIFSSTGKVRGQLQLWPQSINLNLPGYNTFLPTYTGPTALLMILKPQDHITITATRTVYSDPTYAHLTLSGYMLPATSNVIPWQAYMLSNHPNTSGQTQILSNLSFWGNSSQIRVIMQKLIPGTQNSWQKTGVAVFAPQQNAGNNVPPQTLADGLYLVLNPGDRLVFDSQGTLENITASGPTLSAGSPAPWQILMDLREKQPGGSVNGVYVNTSGVGQVVTNLNYEDLEQNPLAGPAPIALLVYTQKLSGSKWVNTGRVLVPASFLTPTTFWEALANADGLNLVLNPGERLVLNAIKSSGGPLGTTQTFYTFSGYAFTP